MSDVKYRRPFIIPLVVLRKFMNSWVNIMKYVYLITHIFVHMYFLMFSSRLEWLYLFWDKSKFRHKKHKKWTWTWQSPIWLPGENVAYQVTFLWGIHGYISCFRVIKLVDFRSMQTHQKQNFDTQSTMDWQHDKTQDPNHDFAIKMEIVTNSREFLWQRQGLKVTLSNDFTVSSMKNTNFTYHKNYSPHVCYISLCEHVLMCV